jgi:hypothetical protein
MLIISLVLISSVTQYHNELGSHLPSLEIIQPHAFLFWLIGSNNMALQLNLVEFETSQVLLWVLMLSLLDGCNICKGWYVTHRTPTQNINLPLILLTQYDPTWLILD